LTPPCRVAPPTDLHRCDECDQALKAGTQGYIIKGMTYESLSRRSNASSPEATFCAQPIKRALASRTPDSELSHREREVLQLLASGNSNRRIGELLGINEATVKSHVSTILMRINAGHSTQAVVSALQRGLVHL
jgi:DNA-binding NarL/FixJ family response regulator